MGFYVNPKQGNKENFLKEKGVEVPIAEVSFDKRPKGFVPVVWINNEAFTAAGVAFNLDELTAFTKASDRRPKRCFYVHVDALLLASDLTEADVERYNLREGGI